MPQAQQDIGSFVQDVSDRGAESLASLAAGAQAIAAETTEYTRKSVEAGSSFAHALFSAQSLEDAIGIQTDYVRRSYEAFVAETSKLGGLYADLAKDAYKPFESLAVTTG